MSTKRDQAFGFTSNTATTTLATADPLTVQAGDLIGVEVGWITAAAATAAVLDNVGGNALAPATSKATHTNNDMCLQAFWGVAQASGTINPQVTFSGGTPLYANIKAYSVQRGTGTAWALGSSGDGQNTAGTAATSTAAAFTGISGSFVLSGVQTYGVRVITPGAAFGNPNEFGSPSTELAAVYSTTQSGTGSIAADVTWSQTIAWMANIVVFEEVTGGDTTAPTLTSPTATGGTLTCSGSVSTNEANGTLYAVVCASATPPTAVQVENGQDNTGAAALRVIGPQSVTATGAQPIASGAVTAGTRYMYFMHKDAAGNRSAVVGSASFVVSAGADTTPPDQAGSITVGTISDTTIQISWPAGTDNVAIAGYDVSSDGGTSWTQLGDVLTTTLTGLTASTTYQLRVRPRDAAGNVDATPLAASATTAATSPAVSSVSTATPQNGASLVLTGTNFGAAGAVLLGGVAQTVTARTGTSITITVARGTNKFNTALGLTVTDSATGLTSAVYNGVTGIAAATGWAVVNLSTPLADTTKRLTTTPDLAAGDQIHYNTGSGSVVVAADATFDTAGAVAFAFEAWTPAAGWGAQGTQTVT